MSSQQRSQIASTARELVQKIRDKDEGHGGLDAFLQEYKLSSSEGIALMCLAEALLRVPENRLDDVVILDLGDKEYPIPLNVFGTPGSYGTTGLVMGAIEKTGDLSGVRMRRFMQAAVVALIQKTAAQVSSQLGMAQTDEISLYDTDGQRLV